MDFEPIVNRVAASDLMVFNLEDFWDNLPVSEIDLAPFLFKGLILKEQDFRQAIKDFDVGPFQGHHVAVFCSTSAVIPTWAYMLVAAKVGPVAASVGFGSPQDVIRENVSRSLATHDWSRYEGRNVIVKGCPSNVITTSAYLDAVSELQRVANKIMYGEACSSVPIWRKPSAMEGQRKAVAAKLPKSS